MTHIPNLIARVLARLSTFGPVSVGASIPKDARPISEADDKEVADMDPQTGAPLAGDGTADGGEVEGGGDNKPQGGDAEESEDDEPDDKDGETSAQPSPDGGTTEGAQEANDGALRAASTAVRAAVDAVVAAPDTEAPGKMSVKFKPTITPAMMKAYEKAVEEGREAEGLSDLIGAALSEALESYDEKRVLPVETTVAEARRVSANNARISEWARKNPEDAKNPDLWAAMTKVYGEYAEKYGHRRADRISMDQLAVIARGELPATRGTKKGGKAEAEAQKRAAVGAGKTPGAIGSVRPKATTPTKGSVGHDGGAYREHLKSGSRDLW